MKFFTAAFAILMFTLISLPVAAQSDPPTTGKEVPAPDERASDQPSVAKVLPQFDRNTVWEAVRIKTQIIYGDSSVEERFKIKRDKDLRRELVSALEGQFQVNIGDDEIRSLKRADDLVDYLFEAQRGPVTFSRNNFQGKVERLGTSRKACKEDGDCLNFIGAMIVPAGFTVTLYNQPKYKGEQMVVNARNKEVRIPNFFNIEFAQAVTTTSKVINWREEVKSVKIEKKKN